MDAIVRLMRLLTWQDFELLVDLIFSASGWRRIGVVGRVQKTVDLELILPTTGERAFVQVKSQASNDDLQDYADRFDQAELYNHHVFRLAYGHDHRRGRLRPRHTCRPGAPVPHGP